MHIPARPAERLYQQLMWQFKDASGTSIQLGLLGCRSASTKRSYEKVNLYSGLQKLRVELFSKRQVPLRPSKHSYLFKSLCRNDCDRPDLREVSELRRHTGNLIRLGTTW